ncbi:hypothetical protein T492DRAFT_835324 [Pavlovales sp. CCMP2436]|nr:hypothetical protein T492DRAFT_835324 [Pavlovales sp. CCMP2436]
MFIRHELCTCAFVLFCSLATGCSTSDATCGTDLYCNAGAVQSVGVGFYSPANNCTRYSCTTSPPRACTPAEYPGSTVTSSIAYNNSGGGSDSCLWACAPAGHVLRFATSVRQSPTGCVPCRLAKPSYYSPALINEEFVCANLVGPGNYAGTAGNPSSNCPIDCSTSGSTGPYPPGASNITGPFRVGLGEMFMVDPDDVRVELINNLAHAQTSVEVRSSFLLLDASGITSACTPPGSLSEDALSQILGVLVSAYKVETETCASDSTPEGVGLDSSSGSTSGSSSDSSGTGASALPGLPIASVNLTAALAGALSACCVLLLLLFVCWRRRRCKLRAGDLGENQHVWPLGRGMPPATAANAARSEQSFSMTDGQHPDRQSVALAAGGKRQSSVPVSDSTSSITVRDRHARLSGGRGVDLSDVRLSVPVDSAMKPCDLFASQSSYTSTTDSLWSSSGGCPSPTSSHTLQRSSATANTPNAEGLANLAKSVKPSNFTDLTKPFAETAWSSAYGGKGAAATAAAAARATVDAEHGAGSTLSTAQLSKTQLSATQLSSWLSVEPEEMDAHNIPDRAYSRFYALRRFSTRYALLYAEDRSRKTSRMDAEQVSGAAPIAHDIPDRVYSRFYALRRFSFRYALPYAEDRSRRTSRMDAPKICSDAEQATGAAPGAGDIPSSPYALRPQSFSQRDVPIPHAEDAIPPFSREPSPSGGAVALSGIALSFEGKGLPLTPTQSTRPKLEPIVLHRTPRMDAPSIYTSGPSTMLAARSMYFTPRGITPRPPRRLPSLDSPPSSRETSPSGGAVALSGIAFSFEGRGLPFTPAQPITRPKPKLIMFSDYEIPRLDAPSICASGLSTTPGIRPRPPRRLPSLESPLSSRESSPSDGAVALSGIVLTLSLEGSRTPAQSTEDEA